MGRRRKSKSSALIDSLKQYVNLKIEYYQLLLTEKVSLLVGRVILLFLFMIMAFAVLLLLLVLVYNLLMLWIGIPWIVTLVEIGIVILLMGIMYIFRQKMIITPIANSIIRMMLDSDDDNDEEEE